MPQKRTDRFASAWSWLGWFGNGFFGLGFGFGFGLRLGLRLRLRLGLGLGLGLGLANLGRVRALGAIWRGPAVVLGLVVLGLAWAELGLVQAVAVPLERGWTISDMLVRDARQRKLHKT